MLEWKNLDLSSSYAATPTGMTLVELARGAKQHAKLTDRFHSRFNDMASLDDRFLYSILRLQLRRCSEDRGQFTRDVIGIMTRALSATCDLRANN